ncbi:hypothetical protein EC991_009468 [Linnemannia zychae]|nr:hypothetical protein EC991_009468 [Linnemannia zychae]
MRSFPKLHTSFPFLVALSSFFTLVQGQQFTPTVVYNAQSAHINGKALYINGGHSNSNSNITSFSPYSSDQAVNQTFYIDLSVSWPTSNPVLHQLPSQPSASVGYGYTSAIFNHSRNWLVGNNRTRQVFDLVTNQWILPQPQDGYINPRSELNPSESVWAVSVDDDSSSSNSSASGDIYFVNGWSSPTLGSAVMDGSSKAVRRIEASVPLSGGYAAVWSSLRKSILVFGGYTGQAPNVVAQRDLYELRLGNNSTAPSVAFELIPGSGEPPLARYGHCMVEAYNGTKMVLFGGTTQEKVTTGEIFVLDVATLTWTRGKATSAVTEAMNASRTYASCAVTNDMFVAYGGITADHATKVWTMVKEPLIVYNLKAGEWQTQFDPEQASGWLLALTKGAFYGIPYIYLAAGAGGLLLLFVILCVFFYFRKQRAERRYSKLMDDAGVSSRSEGGGGFGPASTRSGGGETRNRQAITYLYDQPPTSTSFTHSAAFVSGGGSQSSQQPQMSQVRHSTLYYSEKAPIQIRTHDPITGYPFPQGKVQFFELATSATVTAAAITNATDKQATVRKTDTKEDDNKTPISLDELPEKLYSHPPPELHHRLSSLSLSSTATLPVSTPTHARPEGSSDDDNHVKRATRAVVKGKKDVPVVVSKGAVKAKNKVPLRRELSISKDAAAVKTKTAANKTTSATLARNNRASS